MAAISHRLPLPWASIKAWIGHPFHRFKRRCTDMDVFHKRPKKSHKIHLPWHIIRLHSWLQSSHQKLLAKLMKRQSLRIKVSNKTEVMISDVDRPVSSHICSRFEHQKCSAHAPWSDDICWTSWTEHGSWALCLCMFPGARCQWWAHCHHLKRPNRQKTTLT